jgi:hypothetical protein
MLACRPFRDITIRAVTVGGAVALAQGCGDSLPPPETGRIEVTVATTGPEPDPNGYTLSLDGLQGVQIGTDEARTLTVDGGSHTLELGDLAANCEVAGDRRRQVTVEAGGSTRVDFEVTCSDTAGGIRIVTATTGDLPDPDGYQIVLDSTDPRPIGITDTLELTALPPGDHAVRLLGVAENCTVADGADRTVAVTAGAIADVEYQVACVGSVSRWTPMQSGTEADLSDVWGTSGSSVYAVGELGTDDENGFQLASLVFHYDGSGWMLQRRIRDVSLRGVWGASDTDVWAVGFDFLDDDARVLHYDGTEWAIVPGFESDGSATLGLFAVWGSSASDVYAVGSAFDGELSFSLMFHFDGTAWQRVTIPGDVLPSLSDVWGSSASDVYAVGTDQLVSPLTGTILHYDGGTWTPELQEPNLTINSVWGSSATDVYVAGFTVTEADDQFIVAGAIRHFDGRSWSPVTIPDTGVLDDLYGTGPDDVWAVGENGAILHFDGTGWTITNPTDATLLGVWSSSPADAFAVGNGGIILHGTP